MTWCLKTCKFTGKDSCLFCLFCPCFNHGVSWGQLAGPAASHASVHLRANGSGELLLRPLICVCGLSFPSRLAWLLPKIESELQRSRRDKKGLLKSKPGADTSPFNTSSWAKGIPAGQTKGTKTDCLFNGKDCKELWNSCN